MPNAKTQAAKKSSKETQEKLAAAVKARAASPLLGEPPTPPAKLAAVPAASEAKKAPAAKKSKEAKRDVIPDDAKLTVLFKEVPGRPGTLAYRTRALYLNAKTVGEWREACRGRDADPGYLHGDIRRGLVKVG
ncbi:hypothetical protein [Anaeromyxobacter diazotrophicus]|uniref:Uncharacterized protein n=1 Tax=Anaeromyxobacter diazotrophicus TaxID=2590199 RepID=A0A7I9VJM0_9BACT|nr:hypothetical protein [Anaeromyxobacter diazotrophicus]GEJ56602.1 hypothetical protein AMYX_13430 [Anaeromyxobacter diazotrophicus]